MLLEYPKCIGSFSVCTNKFIILFGDSAFLWIFSQGVPVQGCSALLQPGPMGPGMSDVTLGPDLTYRLLCLKKEGTTICSFTDFSVTVSDLIEIIEINEDCVASLGYGM